MISVSRFCSFILDILCPPTCPVCHEPTETAHCLCAHCYRQLKFITKPYCQICGRPFEYRGLGEPLCAKCMARKPHYDMARAVLEYDKDNNQLIMAFKHGDAVELAPLFTKFLRQADPEIFKGIDYIIPVPLHWSRFLKRKYNQSAVLARHLSKETDIPYLFGVLKRIRATESQGHKSKKQREKNIRNAFTVCHQTPIKNKHILLLDDVMTTGATLNECARILKKNGAKSVKVLTLYRTLPQ